MDSNRIRMVPSVFFHHPLVYVMVAFFTFIELTYLIYQMMAGENSQSPGYDFFPDLVRTIMQTFQMDQFTWSEELRTVCYNFLLMGTCITWMALHSENLPILWIAFIQHCARVILATTWFMGTSCVWQSLVAHISGAVIDELQCIQFEYFPLFICFWCLLHSFFITIIIDYITVTQDNPCKYASDLV